MRRLHLAVFHLFLSVSFCFGQEFDIRMSVGSLHYLGDLAPFRSEFSFSDGHLSTSISYIFKANEVVSYYGKFLVGKISGTDSEANDEERRQRNLSFQSNINEFGVGMHISFVTLNPKFLKYKIDFYATGGVAAFHMNPKTIYNGRLVELQPLGTEGQGIRDSEAEFFKSKYKLWQIAFPVGLGFSFKLTDKFSLGFEIVPRFIFTDYLDDVSSFYLDIDFQEKHQGDLAIALSNRSGTEINGNNIRRGDKYDKDWYVFNSLRFGMALGKLPSVVKKLRI